MKSKVIYTCCVGGYDTVTQPMAIDNDFDYICFSNDIKQESIGIWQIRPIPFSDKNLVKVSRYPKILPHIVLPEYEYSIYIDANIQIVNKEFYNAVNSKVISGCLVAQVNHSVPPVDCIYDDICNAYKYCKISLWDVWKQTRYLKETGFPKHFGLFENNLIFRAHNNEKVINMTNQWWMEFVKNSPRDQFSLMYVYWRNNFMPDFLFDEKMCTRNSPWLLYHSHPCEKRNNQEIKLSERITWHLHGLFYPIVKQLFS